MKDSEKHFMYELKVGRLLVTTYIVEVIKGVPV